MFKKRKRKKMLKHNAEYKQAIREKAEIKKELLEIKRKLRELKKKKIPEYII